MHQLGNFFDRNHCAFQNRENFRQGYGAHLHPSQGELFARDAPREIVHQFLLTQREALDDAGLLALERLAFEHLRNAAPQKIDSGFHFLLECIRLPARQGQQARPVTVLEIVDVAAVRSNLALRMHIFDHPHDHSAAARPGESADKQIVAGRRQFHAHAQRTQRAILPRIASGRLHFSRRFKRDSRRIAVPPQFFRRQARMFRIGIFLHPASKGRYSSTPPNLFPPALPFVFLADAPGA